MECFQSFYFAAVAIGKDAAFGGNACHDAFSCATCHPIVHLDVAQREVKSVDPPCDRKQRPEFVAASHMDVSMSGLDRRGFGDLDGSIGERNGDGLGNNQAVTAGRITCQKRAHVIHITFGPQPFRHILQDLHGKPQGAPRVIKFDRHDRTS